MPPNVKIKSMRAIHSNSLQKVEILGWIWREKIAVYLNELKLLILPSYAGEVPTILLEAMACETPVLATHVGTMLEIIKNACMDFILEDTSPEGVAKNVLGILEYPELEKIVKNASALIGYKFSYVVMVKRRKTMVKTIYDADFPRECSSY